MCYIAKMLFMAQEQLVVQIKCIMVRVLKIYWKIYFCVSRFAKKHKIELRIKQYDEIKHDIICGYYKIRPHFRVGAKHFWEGTVYFRDRTVKGAMMMLNAKFQSISQRCQRSSYYDFFQIRLYTLR